MTATAPGVSMVDRNGMRGGAAISGALLLLAFVFQWDAAVPVLAAALAVGAVIGPRYSPLGATYRAAKATLRLPIGIEPEPAAPPRFAQLLGAICLAIASIALYPLDAAALGATFVLLVAGLQLLLAVTGICVGCEIYLYAKRFGAKEG